MPLDSMGYFVKRRQEVETGRKVGLGGIRERSRGEYDQDTLKLSNE